MRYEVIFPPRITGTVCVESGKDGAVRINGPELTVAQKNALNGARCRCRSGCTAGSVFSELFVPSSRELIERFGIPTEEQILSVAVTRKHRPARYVQRTFPLEDTLTWFDKNRARLQSERMTEMFEGNRWASMRSLFAV
jgi:hypothetical protein